MTTARNDITGDLIKTRPANKAYRESPFWKSVEKENGPNNTRDATDSDGQPGHPNSPGPSSVPRGRDVEATTPVPEDD